MHGFIVVFYCLRKHMVMNNSNVGKGYSVKGSKRNDEEEERGGEMSSLQSCGHMFGGDRVVTLESWSWSGKLLGFQPSVNANYHSTFYLYILSNDHQ